MYTNILYIVCIYIFWLVATPGGHTSIPKQPSPRHVCTASTCGVSSPAPGRFSSSARGREAPLSSAKSNVATGDPLDSWGLQ